MPKKRGIYFAFQGLLVAVLLLLFVYFSQETSGWIGRFWMLLGCSLGSLAILRLVDDATLEKWWFQTGLFLGDALLTALTLHWAGSHPTLLSLYILVIFGTALTRELRQSLAIAGVISILYVLSEVHSTGDPQFWIGLNLLWVSVGLMALLSRDTQIAKREQDELYRERLSRLESLATLGQIAGEVAHRIKGPLTTIRVNAEVLALRTEDDERTQKELGEIQTSVERCKGILKDLLDLGRIEELDLSEEDLLDPIKSALKAAAPAFRSKNIKPTVDLPSTPMPISADRGLIHEAISNLIQNAVQAVSEDGSVKIIANTADLRKSWWTNAGSQRVHRIRVIDSGKGIARKDLENVFKPFFTTKKGEGSGLGLSAALRILEKHQGTVTLESSGLGRGTVATIEIPAS